MKRLSLSHLLFGFLMLICAVRPWLFPRPEVFDQHKPVVLEQDWAFEHWNKTKNALYQLPLTGVEQRFASGFPGAIGRFTDGKSVWVIRHVMQPTRMLHSAIDCYRGLGYKVSVIHVVQKADKSRWRCFNAERGQNLRVCERIFDDKQSEWTDVSAWYWENLFQPGKHEWWAVTQVTQSTLTDNQLVRDKL
jgi:hypothetical protein